MHATESGEHIDLQSLEDWEQELSGLITEQNDNTSDTIFQTLNDEYCRVYGRNYDDVITEPDDTERKLLLSNQISDYLELQKELSDRLKSCSFKLLWENNEPKDGDLGKCVLIYVKAEGSFKLILGSSRKNYLARLEGSESGEWLNNIFKVMDNSKTMIKLGCDYHNFIKYDDEYINEDSDEYKVVGGGSFFVLMGNILISGRSSKFGRMDKKVIEKFFERNGIKVVFGKDDNFKPIDMEDLFGDT